MISIVTPTFNLLGKPHGRPSRTRTGVQPVNQQRVTSHFAPSLVQFVIGPLRHELFDLLGWLNAGLGEQTTHSAGREVPMEAGDDERLEA
mmetsp:Transcript_29984/g.99304  ORF Transcript_29984/g.99304 Transcript_29984/m.99304 type:complete len:90 (+) Transcript_29984:56-325(+)